MSNWKELNRFTYRELEQIRYAEAASLSPEEIACRIEKILHGVELRPKQSLSWETVVALASLVLELLTFFQETPPESDRTEIYNNITQSYTIIVDYVQSESDLSQQQDLLRHLTETIEQNLHLPPQQEDQEKQRQIGGHLNP